MAFGKKEAYAVGVTCKQAQKTDEGSVWRTGWRNTY